MLAKDSSVENMVIVMSGFQRRCDVTVYANEISQSSFALLPDMFRGHDLSVLIALTSLASLTSFIIVVFICVCCYGKRDDESDFGDFDEVKYQNIDAADSPEPHRSDLKTLNKHHALQAPSRTIEKSSLLSPKSIV